MLSDPILEMNGVWKKYSRDVMFHRSLREDMLRLFRTKGGDGLQESEFWAIHDVSFSVMPGDAIGLYGHNGAGKSTILKMIANVTQPTLGNLQVSGRVAPLIEVGAGFHPDLTGKENIFMNGAILGMKISEIKEKYDSIVEFSELGPFIEMAVKKYSSGMYLRLAFSIAIHSDADIYLIDEIIAVGDQAFQAKCLAKIIELKKSGKTLVVVSHSLDLMKQIADNIVYLEKGKVTACD